MDRFQLCRALRAAGVPDSYYEIPGCSQGPFPVDHYFLEERAGEWVVGVHERGARDVSARFPDEDGACRWLYDRLTEPRPDPVPATAEELDTLLRDSEGIQRRAREQFDRAFAEAQRRKSERADHDDHTEPPPAH